MSDVIDRRLLTWFGKYHQHILSHYLGSISKTTKLQRRKDGRLDNRKQPAKTVLELLAIMPELNRDLLDEESE